MSSPFDTLRTLRAVWIALWLLAAAWSARTVARQPVGSRLAHIVPVMAGSAMLFFHLGQSTPLDVHLFPPSLWIEWAGVGLTFLGLAYTCWARIHLGRNWSGSVTLKAGHALIRSGPYALTRHPIYTGLLLAVTGTALARDSIAAVAGLTLLVFGFVVKLQGEERLLTEHFGDAYRAYQAEVPQLIPGLRPAR